MDDSVAVFADQDGRRWHACAFRRAPVGGWLSEGANVGDVTTVIFERPGEDRVTVAMAADEWCSQAGLSKPFSRAIERRTGEDRRTGQERRVVEREMTTERRRSAARISGERRKLRMR